ncbi:MAG TPA: LptF/LptG family permease [Armatimonadota bacterium]|jgi:LPS export ABC transporter permease LptG
MKTADRYLARELTGPFFVGVFGFLMMLVSGKLMDLIRLVMAQSATTRQVMEIVAFRMPQFVVFALPVAMLFGVSLGVNRMARENEISVMRLSGMSLKRIVLPLLAVAAAVSLCSFYINETIVPTANHRASMAEYRLFFKVRPTAIRADVFFGAGPYKFYIGEMQKLSDAADPSRISFRLSRVMVFETRTGAYPVVYTAQTAIARGTRWTLYRGVRRELDANGFTRVDMGFPKYAFDVDRTVGTLWTMTQTPEEMTAAQLSRAIVEGERTGNADVRQWQVEYYLKFALPFACVVLALISMPLAVHFGRGGGFTGILIALLLFFAYIQAYFAFKELGSSLLPPLAAAWLPNAAFALVGAVMLWREE